MKWPFWPIGFWKVEISLQEIFFSFVPCHRFFFYLAPNITLLPGYLWDRTTVSIKYVVFLLFMGKNKKGLEDRLCPFGFWKASSQDLVFLFHFRRKLLASPKYVSLEKSISLDLLISLMSTYSYVFRSQIWKRKGKKNIIRNC